MRLILYRLKSDGSGFIKLDSKNHRFFRPDEYEDGGLEFIGFMTDSIALFFGNRYDEVVVVSLLNDKIRYCRRQVIIKSDCSDRICFGMIRNNVLFENPLKVCNL